LSLQSALRFYKQAITVNSIHSPLMYRLVSHLFDLSKGYYDDYKLEALRQTLLKDKTKIFYTDLGAGSYTDTGAQIARRICDLAKSSSSNKHKCRLIRNIVTFFRPKSILEIGTNLGLSTAYLHSAAKSADLVSVEGADPILAKAKENLAQLHFHSPTLIHSDFDTFFLGAHPSITGSELVYLDGNHNYSSTMKYFNTVWQPKSITSVLIVDDINWSEGMAKAWEEMKSSPDCSSVDLYKIGIIFKDDRLTQPMHIKCVPRILKPWQLGIFG